MEQLDAQGRVHEIPERGQRLKEIAQEYAAKPEGTLVVSPDKESRRAINQVIHHEIQTRGHVDRHEHGQRVLVARHEITGASRQWAPQSQGGAAVTYTIGSTTHGL